MEFNHDERVDACLSMLTIARSYFIVGAALATHYPTAELWEQAMNDGDILEALHDFTTVLDNIAREGEEEFDFLDMEAVTSLSEEHYEEAKQAVEHYADSLQIPADDLLVLLMESGA